MRNVFESVSRGLLLITIGVIFLLINFNILDWSFWFGVVNLWPLILIFLGLGLLFNKHVPFSLILTIFLLALVIYSLVVGPQQGTNFFSPFGNNSVIHSSASRFHAIIK